MRLALLVLLVMDKFVRGEGRATAAGATRADDRIEILQGIAPNTDKDRALRAISRDYTCRRLLPSSASQ